MAVLCYLAFTVWEKISDLEEQDYEFSGILQRIDFDEKGVPKVVINGKKYYSLSTTRSFNNQMAVGDSLIKRKGSTTYILIKRKTGLTLISK